jgi:hypothetical protein
VAAPFVQSASVPVCSSAFEVSESPPRPTQNAEAATDEVVELQFAAGWVHVPLTVANVVPEIE